MICPECSEEIEDLTCDEGKPNIFYCEPCHCEITEDQYFKIHEILDNEEEDDDDDEDAADDDDDYDYNNDYDDEE